MKIYKARKVKTPERGTSRSAGIDFFVPDDFPGVTLHPGQSALIRSGVYAKVPEGYGLFVKNKSGVATKKGLIVGAEVIDEDYQGEIEMHVINVGRDWVEVKPGEKLVQMVLLEVNYEGVELVPTLDHMYDSQTERGANGFGSTGNE